MQNKTDYLYYYDIAALIATAVLSSSIKKYGKVFHHQFPVIDSIFIALALSSFVVILIVGLVKRNTSEYTVFALRTLCTVMILYWVILYLMYG
jgi:uncharacterized membrane protein